MISDPIEEPVVHTSINMCKYVIITSICSNTSLIGQSWRCRYREDRDVLQLCVVKQTEQFVQIPTA